MIKQIWSNFVDKKCFITNVSIELPRKTWIFLKMVTKPKLTNIIKILHFLWKQIVLKFLMQFYKVFQSEEELEQIRAYLVFYDHRHLTLYTLKKTKKNRACQFQSSDPNNILSILLGYPVWNSRLIKNSLIRLVHVHAFLFKLI